MSTEHLSTANLLWLADAPLFIDSRQIASFYDAVVRPVGEKGTTKVTIGEESLKRLEGNFEGSAKIEPGQLAGLLSPLFLLMKPELQAGGTMGGEAAWTSTKEHEVELHAINTPQRQLVQLAVHYLANLPERLFLVAHPDAIFWRKPEVISKSPRALAFLDLPAGTKIIPTAAEFSNGKVVTLFDQLKAKAPNAPAQPLYPEKSSGKQLADERRAYWKWFDTHISARDAMKVIEDTASENGGRIRWIDYRLPITQDGDTLHLHFQPNEQCDTGVFAYYLVKRASKHGIRLVGTLRSEPDMNVLAAYDK